MEVAVELKPAVEDLAVSSLAAHKCAKKFLNSTSSFVFSTLSLDFNDSSSVWTHAAELRYSSVRKWLSRSRLVGVKSTTAKWLQVCVQPPIEKK